VDRVDYNGVSYLCNGAVCGSWWKGRHHDCDEGYAVLDLYDDGSFDCEYMKYGWKAEV
jgi:3',5'-cyclic-AMP phosphodiesterase